MTGGGKAARKCRQQASCNLLFQDVWQGRLDEEGCLEGEIISGERTTCVCRQRVAILVQKIHTHTHIYIHTRHEICKSHSQSTLLIKNKRLEI